ncbi:hypothetical protein MIT9_P1834 [Methylomarinovum caldicuralii]|uniref:Ice-binding protein C-terminal domain-containing protein n=1 Tax=Methylomarinovum caldicuralii TaxID=438856 RepID=A0AAU9CCF6_9GAMM|nr:PEP-CTERM sorting domain-containing protein [Methylomarinovum caldicuralii]BCX82249.1 hypothetical protein MIT9_P1834 [Methylomarinovum caldicuralii]
MKLIRFCLGLALLLAGGVAGATPLNCAGSYPYCDIDGDTATGASGVAGVPDGTDVITISENAVPAGVVTYLDTGSGTPVPQKSGGPAALDMFSFGDTVRAGELFDFTHLSQAALNAALSNWGSSLVDKLVWTVVWNAPSTMADPATDKQRNDVEVPWSTLSSALGPGWQFFTDPLVLDERGDWQVDSYVNGVFIHGWKFTVPEPGSLLLMGIGLLGLMVRQRINMPYSKCG